MSNVHALMFDTMNGAENFYVNLETWEEQGIITVLDAVVATRNIGKEVELHQVTKKKTGRYAAGGGGAGFLAGMLLGGPILGLAAGAGIGAVTARMKDQGLDKDFINGIVEGIRPETSVLFLMTEGGDVDALAEELRPHKAQLLSTSLTGEQEETLRQLLSSED
jgi:uncharacterized membrane protein